MHIQPGISEIRLKKKTEESVTRQIIMTVREGDAVCMSSRGPRVQRIHGRGVFEASSMVW